ncbi:radical SAM protein [Gandjariella thermophila]|uniref:Radical SAM core domain-containing protein n=1 Tax=Gandjariella thermophila TaxID=1931992 RepID=A0A4D4JEN7_9PSEU|nr:radical SAM protein [Gandjariella thermophila]GDY33892.1 hypothetical protein GTS_55250 [Gandjariella thermophila]
MSIKQLTGIRSIRTLYLQLLYRCNYNCLHCFHGENLKRRDRITATQAFEIMSHFVSEYATSRVVLLGGEPFLHDAIVPITAGAHDRGLYTEICTNGHQVVRRKLTYMVDTLDRLRVSLDGLREAHDDIRKAGSYDDAVKTIKHAIDLGLKVGVTLTVTSRNVEDLPQLVEEIADLGVGELKLHQLRPVGNAEGRTDLLVEDKSTIQASLERCSSRLELVLDDDLIDLLDGLPAHCDQDADPEESLARIEMSPDGALTMSCKAVGRNAHAFVWDLAEGGIEYVPSENSEIALAIPDVRYVTLTRS